MGITSKEIEAFHETIRGYGYVSDASLTILLQYCQLDKLSRYQHLTTEDHRNDFEYFLLSGLAHRYTITESGELVSTGFYLPQTAMTPHFARTNQGVSLFAIQVLTAATVLKIKVADLDLLRSSHADIRNFGQQVVGTELSRMLRMEIAFRSMTAKERLCLLRSEYPNLENVIPHTIIASYLGITPVSFSRLRSETL